MYVCFCITIYSIFCISFRLDPGDDLDVNRRNLIALTKTVFDTITTSGDRFPPQLRSMCHCLYQVLSKRFPNLLQNNIGAVGTVIFLRFINPAIGKK